MIQARGRWWVAVVAAAALTTGCGGAGEPATTSSSSAALEPDLPADPHSFADPAAARVEHVDLRLVVDFAARRLEGTASLAVARAAGADSLYLDTRDLEILEVTDGAGRPLGWALDEPEEHLGRALRVALPAVGDTVRVRYRTSPEAAAVQWLGPAQTDSGRPFLFTQGQAILTRTWVPTQDSPGIRQTYTASVTVPGPLTAVMSAELETVEGEASDEGRVFRFRMDRPIPPYLIALAVGDLEFGELGPRTGVWAEPGVVDAAAHEFAEMEAMLDAAERLYGPYRWGRYDVLVLPPSFPFGGMENPRLTFATPTILAGDRSLVSLIAHELAHSWSGNLVTNATWADFWLNEGFTTYIENRIMEEIHGADYAAMLESLNRAGLHAEIDRLGGRESPETVLHSDLTGRDPDDGMTDIPYDKGAAFLRTIETVVGRDRFDAFLRHYFDDHAFQPMTTEWFLDYLDRELLSEDPRWAAAVRPEAWVHEPGLPDNAPPVQAAAFHVVEEQVARFEAGTEPEQLATAGWSTHEWLHFLQSLPDSLADARMAALDRAFELTQSGNSEILFEWLRMAIVNRYEPALPALRDFLTRQGRRKFLEPLYRELARSDWGRALARDIYTEARPTYHAISRSTVDQVLDWSAD